VQQVCHIIIKSDAELEFSSARSVHPHWEGGDVLQVFFRIIHRLPCVSRRVSLSRILRTGAKFHTKIHVWQVLWIRDQGSGIRDQGSGIRDQGSGIRDQGSEDVTGGFAAARMLGCRVFPPPPARSAHEFLIPDS
jgi:hypothetical protein